MIPYQLDLPLLQQVIKDFVSFGDIKVEFFLSSSMHLFLAHGIYLEYFHT
jgi:hypothetical protein